MKVGSFLIFFSVRRFKKRQLRKERKFFQKMDGNVAALLGFMCILLLAGGMYFLFLKDEKIDAGGGDGERDNDGLNPSSCSEYECPTLYTQRENAEYLETDDQDTPVESCCVPRTCQLVDCSERAMKSDPEKLTAVLDFIDKENEDARVNFCCIATEESKELEKQKSWVLFWIVIASVIGLVGITGVLTFKGWTGLIELPYILLTIPSNLLFTLGKVLTGNGTRYSSVGNGVPPPQDPNEPLVAAAESVQDASANTARQVAPPVSARTAERSSIFDSFRSLREKLRGPSAPASTAFPEGESKIRSNPPTRKGKRNLARRDSDPSAASVSLTGTGLEAAGNTFASIIGV